MLHSAGLNVSRLYSDPRAFFSSFFSTRPLENAAVRFLAARFFAAVGNDASRTGPNPEREHSSSSLFLSFFYGNVLFIIVRPFLNTGNKLTNRERSICLGILINFIIKIYQVIISGSRLEDEKSVVESYRSLFIMLCFFCTRGISWDLSRSNAINEVKNLFRSIEGRKEGNKTHRYHYR